MSFIRVVLAIIFPPLAVIDKGCGSFVIVTILSVLGWIPGVLAALVIVSNEKPKEANNEPTFEEKADKLIARMQAWGERKKAERESRSK